MNNVCERTASSGGADGGNVLKQAVVFHSSLQGCHPHRSNVHNAPLPLIFVYDSKIAV